MSLVANERTKLFANALDRASTACIAVGVLAPIVAAMYGSQAAAASALFLYLGSLFWFMLAAMLHFSAQIVLSEEARMNDLFFVAYVAVPLTLLAIACGGVYAHKMYMDRKGL